MDQHHIQLLNSIEKLRKKMHNLAKEKGISDYEVLNISQVIDEKLNEYYYLVQKN